MALENPQQPLRRRFRPHSAQHTDFPIAPLQGAVKAFSQALSPKHYFLSISLFVITLVLYVQVLNGEEIEKYKEVEKLLK